MKVLQIVVALALFGCAGEDGEQGPPGPPGPPGMQGPPGTNGGNVEQSDIVTDGIYCSANDGTTFVSAYIWLFADGDGVGHCFINESGTQYAATSPIINGQCALESILNAGLVFIDFAVNPPPISGALVGYMECL